MVNQNKQEETVKLAKQLGKRRKQCETDKEKRKKQSAKNGGRRKEGSTQGEWPSGLRRCDQNWKVPGSNPTRHSAGLRDPTSL